MQLRCGATTLDLSRPQVMGVLNVTPDSFSDGGRFATTEAALAHARAMMGAGAALIDVGGESTRPGAEPVPVAQELERVLPVIERLVEESAVPVSIDTRHPEVMRAALEAGASMVNDVTALRSPESLQIVAESNCAVCLMHMQGEPRTMQRAPSYVDVVGEVRSFLAERVAACVAAGIALERLVIDPGFGFGKTLAHNLELLRHLGSLGERPVLVGLSRKSMVARLTGDADPLPGSLALAVVAALQGARLVRAHDVGPTVAALKIVAAMA
jgi:dihydropteroate synthase